MEVTVGVGGFPVNAVVKCAVWASGDENIQKGYFSRLFLIGNLMLGCCWLRYCRNSRRESWPWGHTSKVSSTFVEPQTGSEVSGEE